MKAESKGGRIGSREKPHGRVEIPHSVWKPHAVWKFPHAVWKLSPKATKLPVTNHTGVWAALSEDCQTSRDQPHGRVEIPHAVWNPHAVWKFHMPCGFARFSVI
ncbi:hypothetical protein LINGRAHAP2_LOCUS2392 [Linum grandiflorum]